MDSVLNRRDELPEAVAGWFKALLIKVKDTDESIEMPQEIYVEMRTRPSWMIPGGEVSAKWRITRLQVIRLPVAYPRPPHVAPAVGYYRIAWGEFSVSEDGKFVTIGFKLGPKFGRGDVYRVTSDSTQNLVLERVRPAWELHCG